MFYSYRQISTTHIVFGDDIIHPLAILTERYRYINPKYDPSQTSGGSITYSNVDNDIAIIELTAEVKPPTGVPICLTHWYALSHTYAHTGYGFGHTRGMFNIDCTVFNKRLLAF